VPARTAIPEGFGNTAKLRNPIIPSHAPNIDFHRIISSSVRLTLTLRRTTCRLSESAESRLPPECPGRSDQFPASNHQIIFRASCNCLDVVTVEGDHSADRVEAAGRSGRCCRLLMGKLEVGTIQDIENFKPQLGIKGLGNSFEGIVLEQRRIKFTKPGPRRMLRPTLPRRFEQVPATPGLNGSGVFAGHVQPKPKGMHWAAREAELSERETTQF